MVYPKIGTSKIICLNSIIDGMLFKYNSSIWINLRIENAAFPFEPAHLGQSELRPSPGFAPRSTNRRWVEFLAALDCPQFENSISLSKRKCQNAPRRKLLGHDWPHVLPHLQLALLHNFYARSLLGHLYSRVLSRVGSRRRTFRSWPRNFAADGVQLPICYPTGGSLEAHHCIITPYKLSSLHWKLAEHHNPLIQVLALFWPCPLSRDVPRHLGWRKYPFCLSRP